MTQPAVRAKRPGHARVLDEPQGDAGGRPCLRPQSAGRACCKTAGGLGAAAVKGADGCRNSRAARLRGVSQIRSASWKARQLAQRHRVHVGARGQPVIGAGQAGPGAGRLAGVAVVEDVRQLVLYRGHPQRADLAAGVPMAVVAVASRCSACTRRPSVRGFPVGVAVDRAFEDLRGGRNLGHGRLQNRLPAPGWSRRGTPGRGRRSRGLRTGPPGSAGRPAGRRRSGGRRPGR